jgi:SAM-dependent methyltransferase
MNAAKAARTTALRSRVSRNAASRTPERLIQAVDLLEVSPEDRILEIGCGRGVAVSLVCERLAGGTVTAIDRSQKMIDAAKARNAHHVASGKAVLRTAALADADFGGARFNKVFAVNVNVFWLGGAREHAVLRKVLEPGGRVFLIYDSPPVDRGTSVLDRLTAGLLEAGFSNVEPLPGGAGLDRLTGVRAGLPQA